MNLFFLVNATLYEIKRKLSQEIQDLKDQIEKISEFLKVFDTFNQASRKPTILFLP